RRDVMSCPSGGNCWDGVGSGMVFFLFFWFASSIPSSESPFPTDRAIFLAFLGVGVAIFRPPLFLRFLWGMDLDPSLSKDVVDNILLISKNQIRELRLDGEFSKEQITYCF